MATNKIELIDYVNVTGRLGGYGVPELKGYDAEDNEYLLELDIYETATANWNRFKNKFRMANKKEFFAEFAKAKTDIFRK